jgi:hypothetical protein
MSRLSDLETNFNKETNINLLNNPIITTRSAKLGVYNWTKNLPAGNILTVGIPKGLIDSDLKSKQKIVKLLVSRVNELKPNENYPKISFRFDLNTFLVWDYDVFYSTGPTLRKFANSFNEVEFNDSTSHYDNLTQSQKDEILNNHKISAIFDLYLSVFTGLQVDETSVFDKNVTNILGSVGGELSSKKINNALRVDPMMMNYSSDQKIKNQIDLFRKTLNTYSDSKMIKLFTTTAAKYDRVFNIFVPSTDAAAVWEYQVEIDDGTPPPTPPGDELPTGGTAVTDALTMRVETIDIGDFLNAQNLLEATGRPQDLGAFRVWTEGFNLGASSGFANINANILGSSGGRTQ